MLTTSRTATASLLALALAAGAARAADPADNLKAGNPDVKSIGALAFGPEGILFFADPQGAAIFAVDTGDRPSPAAARTPAPVNVEKIDAKVAALLGTSPRDIQIRDIAVNPASGKVYLSVARGRGPDAAPVLLRVDGRGEVEEVALKDVKFARAPLASLPTKPAARQDAITDLAYVDGRVFVAGLSNEEFSSTLRAIPFPFSESAREASLEIFHGAHGRFETAAPVRTFVPYEIEGEPYLLAAYTCTPLVKFRVADLKAGAHVKGTTIAELGNRNKPLDMIVYRQGGKTYLLLANSSRGVMKIATDRAASQEGIVKRISDKAGLPYETIADMKGVEQLDKLDEGHAVALVRDPSGALDLKTAPLP